MSLPTASRPVDYEKIKGSTLIIPAISIGNIPQLATDLLLHNLGFTKVGTLLDLYLYPYISGVDHLELQKPPSGVLFALEVYYNETFKVTLIQQRSPIIPGMTRDHVEKVLGPFASGAEFSRILVLDLADAGLEEQTAPIRVFSKGSVNLLLGQLNLLNSSPVPTIHESEPIENLPRHLDPYTAKLVEFLSPSLSVVMSFVYEGDNSHDALVMASTVCHMLKLGEVAMEKPVSWFGVYGDRPIPNALEEGLYG